MSLDTFYGFEERGEVVRARVRTRAGDGGKITLRPIQEFRRIYGTFTTPVEAESTLPLVYQCGYSQMADGRWIKVERDA